MSGSVNKNINFFGSGYAGLGLSTSDQFLHGTKVCACLCIFFSANTHQESNCFAVAPLSLDKRIVSHHTVRGVMDSGVTLES